MGDLQDALQLLLDWGVILRDDEGDRRELSAVLQNSQLPLSKVATLYFDELVILDPVGARWTITGKEQA